jgi:putative peptidoglycan lipid II flippase
MTALVVLQVTLLVIALIFTPEVVRLLAPGLDPARFDLAVALTRITFPYLALMSIETLIAGTLNANQRFAVAAGAPVLLNVCMIGTLLMAGLFPTAGHAAAWGVLAAGILQALVVAADAEHAGFGIRLKMPQLDEPTRKFLTALGPAIIGAGGVQLALFADTIIATFLPAGAISALYYADRINQLPIGVIGIAAGTVLLPEMSRRLAAGDAAGAADAQGRAIELTLLLSIPFVAGAIAIPELVMRALFARGAFTLSDAQAAAMTLAAYATGLLPFVLMRSYVAPFLARGDTATPVKAALSAVAANILLKIGLVGPLAQVGLALATSVGAWINLALLVWWAKRRSFESPGVPVQRVAYLLIAGVVLGAALFLGERYLHSLFGALRAFREESLLICLLVAGALIYVAMVWALVGRTWLRDLMRDRGSPAVRPQAGEGD